MSERTMNFYVNGTSALVADDFDAPTTSARIIKFLPREEKPSLSGPARNLRLLRSIVLKRVKSLLDASEMYCSLKLEDFRGCAYGAFSIRSIAVLAGVSSVIAVISLIVGA